MKRSAVAHIVREVDGRMLCVWNKRYAGWTLPGGLVEEGETPVQAVKRELLEETGLRTFHAHPLYDGPVETLLRDGRGTHVHVFQVIPLMQDDPREREVGCPVTWLTREEFLAWSPFSVFYTKMFKELEK